MLEAFFENLLGFFPNPDYGLASIMFFLIGVYFQKQAKSMKWSVGAYENKTSQSAHARGIKTRQEIVGYLFKFTAKYQLIISLKFQGDYFFDSFLQKINE